MITKIWFWLCVSRLFSLPMTILSWLVIFIYTLNSTQADILNGILALIGISTAHLATNLADDYFDYKQMLKDGNMMSTVVKNKCIYLKDGTASLNDVLRVVIIYCTISVITGIILTLRSGLDVIWLAVIGGILTLSYSKLSRIGLSEIAVGIAFGPLFFEGVYYVMAKEFSLDVFILSVAVGAFTVAVLYVHTVLDFDSDMISHKKTLCCRVGDKNKAMIPLYIFFTTGFACAAALALRMHKPSVMLSWIAIPFAVSVCNALKKYNKDKSFLPEIKWWHYPLDNWEKIKSDGTQSFYFVLYQSRNLMLWFSLLILTGLLI